MIYLEVVLWCLVMGWWLYRLSILLRMHMAGAYDPRGVFYNLLTLVVLATFGKGIWERLMQVI